MYLAGASTGCQKIVYWAHKHGRGVKALFLFAPISDYASERMLSGAATLRKVVKIAEACLKKGRKHELLPTHTLGWSFIADAQRTMSLYSGKGAEEVFTYWDPARIPKTLKSVRIPMLVFLAQHDEYADRPAEDIAEWFKVHLHRGRVIIVPRASHSFKGAEQAIVRDIRKFISNMKKA